MLPKNIKYVRLCSIVIITIIVMILINKYDTIIMDIKTGYKYGYGYTYRYQHNKDFTINKHTYRYVYEYKKQLLKHITDLLKNLNIRHVISNGCLIEYLRKKPIYHDDDLDIRFFVDDYHKWEKYYNDILKNGSNFAFEYNLNLGIRNPETQVRRGVQMKLIKFNNSENIITFPGMDIHADVVSNNVRYAKTTWIPYDIDYNNVTKIKFYCVDTYIPNDEDIHKVLKAEYGPNYMIPNTFHSITEKETNIPHDC